MDISIQIECYIYIYTQHYQKVAIHSQHWFTQPPPLKKLTFLKQINLLIELHKDMLLLDFFIYTCTSTFRIYFRIYM